MKRLLVCVFLVLFTVGLGFSATLTFKESPALAAQVKAGKLPAVTKRLPVNPLVVTPDKVGTYGGTWRMGMTSGTDDPSFYKIFAYEPLVRWNPAWTEITPNVAERWETNSFGTSFTFYLRKGMKWSDGSPFTADDIVFWWEDVELNKDLAPNPPNWMVAGGVPGKVVKIDDTTVRFDFQQTNGMFLKSLASADGRSMLNFPKKFAMQFHAKYADKAKLDDLVRLGGDASWKELFIAKVCQPDGGGFGQYNVAGRPTIYAWMTEQPMSGSATQVVFVRNPYYWKVDPTGQQYPYIDKLVYGIYQDLGAMLLKGVNGEIDFQMRHFNTLTNKAVLYDNRAKGNYRLFDLVPVTSNAVVVHLNLTHKDPVMRAIFQNKDFRIGLSQAINRKEIIDTVYVGQSKPWQAAPLENSPYYNKQLATQYLEFDVQKANEYLDKAGLTKKDASGMRLRPDGKPLTFTIEASTAPQDIVDALNMIVKHWKAVGIAVEAKIEDRSLMYQRVKTNDVDGMVWNGEGGIDAVSDPRNFFPNGSEANYAIPWANWYNGIRDATAEEPPAEVKAIQAAFEKVKMSPTFDGQVKTMAPVLQMSADYFFCIGVCTPPLQYGIVSNKMMNVPSRMIAGWQYPTPAPLNTFSFFYTK